jgi:hypothetical protein
MRSIVKLGEVVINKASSDVNRHVDRILLMRCGIQVRQQGMASGRDIGQGSCALQILDLAMIARVSDLAASAGAFPLTSSALMAGFEGLHRIE